jgi:transposase
MNTVIESNVVNSTTERAPVETGVTIKLGLDVHAEQITVCRQIDGALPQPAQKFSWERAVAWIAEQIKAASRVYSCYEAGPCGYGLHRKLTALGVINYVVAPQRWDERGRRVKTDKRDARELCNRLERYVRGNTDAFAVVRVPTPEQEQVRALTRQRGAVQKERLRCIVRGHGLMLAQGVRAPEQWWTSTEWPECGAHLPDWLRPHVQWWQSQAVRLDQELAQVTRRVEALSQGQPAPKGMGALTTALLNAEMLDWGRFDNRRQVGSYTGLCPSEASSGERRKQGAISKHGNPRVRHQLIEAVWRLDRWQPNYPPLKKLRAASGARARKRAVVAVARRLAVDLWRIHTGRCPAEKLGLVVTPAS